MLKTHSVHYPELLVHVVSELRLTCCFYCLFTVLSVLLGGADVAYRTAMRKIRDNLPLWVAGGVSIR